MPAWDTARTWWQEHSTVPFEERLGWHLSCGLVYATPSVFLMVHELCWDPLNKRAIRGQPNAWFCEMAVLTGSETLAELFRVVPHRHEWVLFARHGGFQVHAWKWYRMIRKLKQSTN